MPSGTRLRLLVRRGLGNQFTMPTDSKERRRQPRAALARVILVRPLDSKLRPDICTTFNISKDGMYLATLAAHCFRSADVYVMSDPHPGGLLRCWSGLT
jgi:hypothetical protein